MPTRFIALLAGVLLFASVHTASAQQSDIQGTIDSQLEAFQADDFATAFTFATPHLQLLFQSPRNFKRMVTQGYPMVWRPAEVRYLTLRREDGAMVQTVEIRDVQGRLHLLDYRMEQTSSGWRIAGVKILQGMAVSA